ncbi:MAG: TadE/TadG family type IV pilus assembly protein [Planctomycetota bacterium]
MITFRTNVIPKRSADRKGVAAVEFALLSPLLVLITMGTIDTGQFVNMSQLVNDASCEGTRHASQNTTLTQAEVRAVVVNYFSDQFPGVSASSLDSALTVNVFTASTETFVAGDLTVVASGDLKKISSGYPVGVQVIFRYDTIRWLSGFPGLNGKTIETTTVMRRE